MPLMMVAPTPTTFEDAILPSALYYDPAKDRESVSGAEFIGDTPREQIWSKRLRDRCKISRRDSVITRLKATQIQKHVTILSVPYRVDDVR